MQDIISPPPGLDIPPPVPITKYYTRRERIGCSWVNFFAISAIYRIFFILFAIGGLIAAIMAQQGNDAYNRYPGYASLRIAYIIFVIIALLVQIAIFTLDVINAFAVRPLNRLPVNLIILVIDGVLFLSILVISVFCISKANALSTDSYGPNSFGYYFYNATAFYAAGIFGYMMSLLFLEEIIYLGLQILARRMACSCWYFCR